MCSGTKNLRCLGTPLPWTKHLHKQLGKRLDYGEIGDKFGVGASTAYLKVNTAGTDENLFRLVRWPNLCNRLCSYFKSERGLSFPSICISACPFVFAARSVDTLFSRISVFCSFMSGRRATILFPGSLFFPRSLWSGRLKTLGTRLGRPNQ